MHDHKHYYTSCIIHKVVEYFELNPSLGQVVGWTYLPVVKIHIRWTSGSLFVNVTGPSGCEAGWPLVGTSRMNLHEDKGDNEV